MKRKENALVRILKSKSLRIAVLFVVFAALLAVMPFALRSSAADEPLYSGTYGTCTWVVDADGKLTIAPADGVSGVMPSIINEDMAFNNFMNSLSSSYFFTHDDLLDPDSIYYFVPYSPDGAWPWTKSGVAESITSVKIEEGVRPSMTKFTYPYINTVDISDMFKGLKNCVSMDLSGLDIGPVTNKANCVWLKRTFANCSSLQEITGLNTWDLKRIYGATYAFSGCESLTSLDISGWEYEMNDDPVDVSYMFADCVNLESLDMGGNVGFDYTANMRRMFYHCRKLSDLNLRFSSTGGHFDEMFYDCVSLREIDLRSLGNINDSQVPGMFGCSGKYGRLLFTRYLVGANTAPHETEVCETEGFCKNLPVNKFEVFSNSDETSFFTVTYTPGEMVWTNPYRVEPYTVKSVTVVGSDLEGNIIATYEVDLEENPESYTVDDSTWLHWYESVGDDIYNIYNVYFDIQFAASSSVIFYDRLNSSYLESTGLKQQSGIVGTPITDPYSDYSAVPLVRDINDNYKYKHFVGWDQELVFGNQEHPDSNAEEYQKFIYAIYEENNYTIRYHANGGEGTMPDQPYAYGNGIDFLENQFTREHAKFVGWSLNPDDDYTIKNTTLDDLVFDIDGIPANGSVIDVYAIWENEIRIRFNANGGEGTMEDQYFASGVAENLIPNQFTKEGYIFKGWSKSSDGSGWVYADQDSFRCFHNTEEFGDKYTEDDVIDLYALWESAGFVVHFDANGGEGEMADQFFRHNQKQELNANEFTRVGHSFLGWSLDPNATEITYTDKQLVGNIVEVGEVTLYAVWGADSYEISFNDNFTYYWTAHSQIVAYGTGFTLRANTYEHRGYKLMGWDTSRDADTVVFTDQQALTIAEMYETAGKDLSDHLILLYAVWEPIRYTVIFDPNGGDGERVTHEMVFDGEGLYAPFYDELGYTPPENMRPVKNQYWKCEYALTKDFSYSMLSGERYGNFCSVDGDTVTCYAQWEPDTYTIHFDANGGKGEMEDQVMTRGVEAALNANEFTYDYGVKFLGWSTDPDAAKAAYTDKQKVNNITDEDEITLYAVWNDTRFKFVGAQLSIGNNLDMKFVFPKLKNVNMSKYYIEIARYYAGSDEPVISKVPFSQWGNYNSSNYMIVYSGFAAKEMSDKVVMHVCDGNGNHVSQPWVDSIRDYSMRALAKSTLPEERTVFVDMLNYGAEVQKTKNYDTGNLANALLTDQQRAYGIQGEVSAVSSHEHGDKFAGSILAIESNLRFLIVLEDIDPDTMYAKARLVNHYGAFLDVTVNQKDTDPDFVEKYGYYCVELNNLVAADARSTVYVTVYNKDGSIYTQTEDSVEDYFVRLCASSEEYYDLQQATLKFSDAAYAYLHRND